MNEIEAFALKPGDVVAVRRPGAFGHYVRVLDVHDRDMTTELAEQLFALPHELAKQMAFDGPIIECLDCEDNRVLWRAAYVSRPVIACEIRCAICHSKFELHLPAKGYSLYKRGMRPSSSCLPDEPPVVTTFLDSKICRGCNPYYHHNLMEVE